MAHASNPNQLLKEARGKRTAHSGQDLPELGETLIHTGLQVQEQADYIERPYLTPYLRKKERKEEEEEEKKQPVFQGSSPGVKLHLQLNRSSLFNCPTSFTVICCGV